VTLRGVEPLRDTLRASPGTSTVTTFLDALGRNGWHSEAACAGRGDVFLCDDTLGWAHPESPTVLLALLICAGCPVRRPCLEESLREARVPLVGPHSTGEPAVPGSSTGAPASGVWAGTTLGDRRKVRRLPRAEAAELLEREFPERLARRVAAFQRRHANGHRPHWRAREVRRRLVGIAAAGVERENGNGR
jgi:hypothetical protein